jgi:hypothetical protein
VIGGFATAFLAAALSFALDLPGAFGVGLLLALAVVSATILSVCLKGHQAGVRYAFATAVAVGVMWVVITRSMVRFDYYNHARSQMEFRGETEKAAALYEKALRYLPEGKKPTEKVDSEIFD